MIRKNYNLATPELIAKLWLVGAVAQPYKYADGRQRYMVRVPSEHVATINPLLSGTKIKSNNTFYSKDVWNALFTYSERRTSYGHLDTPKTTKKAPTEVLCCGDVKSFKFSDGKIIAMCPTHSGRTNHHFISLNSTRKMDVKRRNVLCGGAR